MRRIKDTFNYGLPRKLVAIGRAPDRTSGYQQIIIEALATRGDYV